MNDINMRQFSKENRARCTAPNGFNQPLESWSLSDWMTATLGELGEAANVLKKLNRVRDGLRGNKETPEELQEMFADEIEDAYISLDLLADRKSAVEGKIASGRVEPGGRRNIKKK